METCGGQYVSWTDRAVLLTVARVGKQTLVLEVLTENYGRCRAVATLDGKEAPILLPGSFLTINCTNDKLGEPLRAKLLEISGGIIAESADDVALLALTSAKDLMVAFLDEEDPVPEIYDATQEMMQSLVSDDKRWPVHYAALEFALLTELGHVRGMSDCMPAVRHGETIYMSPKSARMVTREQAGAFLDRMVPVPGLLLGQQKVNAIDVRLSLELNKTVFENFALPTVGLGQLPDVRADVVSAAQRVRDIPKPVDRKNNSGTDEDARRKRLISTTPLMVAGRGGGAA